MKKLLIGIVMLGFVGCLPDKHHGHIYVHDPNHIEVAFDGQMSMKMEKDGLKVEASSIKGSFFEDLLKFILLRPR